MMSLTLTSFILVVVIVFFIGFYMGKRVDVKMMRMCSNCGKTSILTKKR